MNSAIVLGVLEHTRKIPKESRFKFRHSMLLIKLDDLARKRGLPWYITNKVFAPITIKNSHYINSETTSIINKIHALFVDRDLESYSLNWFLLTTPRFFRYTFNPASFFFGMDEQNKLSACVVQVNNTFGESHLYILDDCNKEDDGYITKEHAKEFHVSPFISREGDYRFTLGLTNEKVLVEIALKQNSALVMQVDFYGKLKPISGFRFARSLFWFMVSSWLTEPRIMRQAFKLYFRLKLRLYRRPKRGTGTIDGPAKGIISKLKLPF